MNPLDAVLLLLAALAVVVGYRIGLVCGVVSLLSVFFGALIGFGVARVVLAVFGGLQDYERAVYIASCILMIIVGQVITAGPAQRLHDAVKVTAFRTPNSVGGAVLTVAFGTVVVWMMATALALAPSTSLASLMRGSAMLAGLDRAVPVDAGPLFSQLEQSAGIRPEPRIFTGLGLVPAPQAAVPAPDEVPGRVLRVAAASVVRIVGRAECGRTLAGSGVVVGDGLVLTNAHVVAGVREPLVFPKDDLSGAPAVPVSYDTVRDVAVLRVPGLDLPAVPIGPDPEPSQLVAVAGFPNAGPQEVKASRVRATVAATGSDLYGHGSAQRQVVVIAGDVIPGDSGGPLLSQNGEVVGLVFASAVGDSGHTGYALTASEATSVLASGPLRQRVSTGDCVPE